MQVRYLLACTLLLLSLSACPPLRGAAPVQPTPGAAPVAEGRLLLEAGRLSYLSPSGERRGPASAANFLPYAIVASGPPTLLSCVDSGLRTTSYAVAAGPQGAIHSYPDCLPLLSRGGARVLSVLPADPLATGGIVLLAPDGSEAARLDNAELLWPAAGDSGAVLLAALPGEGANLIDLFGRGPQVLIWDSAAGRELGRVKLPDKYSSADLVAVGASAGYVLLMQQYDYEHFQFSSLELATRKLEDLGIVTGQPAYTLVYPGEDSELRHVAADKGHIELLANAGTEMWDFDLAAAALTRSPANEGAELAREENGNPQGGAGEPGPGSVPLPQALLPTAAGPSWTIPALTDGAGHVLVVDSTGARWLALDGTS